MTKGLGIAQVAGLATEFTNYTDTSVGKVHGRIDSLQRTHDFNHQRVLEAITEKMNLVNREIEDLHRESMTAVNGTQQYAEDVESAMKAGDLRLDGMIKQIEIDYNSLDEKEKADWTTLSAALQAAEEKQEVDRQTLDSKIDTDVGDLRTESSDALAAEKREIRQQLAEAMAIIADGIVSLTQNTTERYDGIQQAIDQMIAEQTANNEEQAQNISRARRRFERDRDAAYARLDAADVRLDKAFRDLAAAKGRLESEAAADYAYLLNKINTDVSLRDNEAAALRGWAKVETDALRTSLTETQNTLDAERNRLQAQRNADMESMPAKIVGDVNSWNESVNAQMDTDNTVIHATLTSRMQEAAAALHSLQGKMGTNNGNLQAQYDGMKELQAQNNALQQKAIDDLQRDSILEKTLTKARLAALDGNLTFVKERLAMVKSEITGIQDADRADIRARVKSGFAATKTTLEGDLSKDHTALWDKLNGGISTITTNLKQLQDIVEARENRILQFSDQINTDQRHQSTKQNLEMDEIDRTQHGDEREIDTLTDSLLEILGTVKARLATELSRVGVERDHDDAQMRSKIDSENNVTETDAQSKLATLDSKMKVELNSMFTELKASFNAQKLKEETDFQELVGNLTAWETAQKAENARQRAWLQTIADASKNAAGDIGSQTAALRSALKQEDKRLTASGTELENQQRATALAINTSLHAGIASLNADTFAFVTRTRLGVKAKIDSDVGDLTARLNQLQATAKDTETTVQSATDAMRDKIEARRVARAAEVAGIKQKAADEKAKMEALIDGLLQRIEQGKGNIRKELKKSAKERNAYATGVKSFITSKVQVAEGNFSAQVASKEAQFVAMLQEEVDQWTSELKANKEASITEAAAVDVKLRQLQQAELLHRTNTNQRLVQLLSAVENNKDSADTAIAALSTGLNVEIQKLNSTVATVKQDQQDDKARVLSLIQDGLVLLRANFSAAQAVQLASMKGTLNTASRKIDAKRNDMLAEILRKEGILNQSLATIRGEQLAAGERHQQQILEIKKMRLEVKARVLKALNILEGSSRLLKNKFENAQHRLNTLQTQDFADLHAKLDRAIVQLNSESTDMQTKVDKSMLAAKANLGTAKAALTQMHEALVREQASGQVAIKSEVKTRIEALSGTLQSNIQSAVTTLESALYTQLTNIASGVDSIKTKTESAEQDLVSKMGQLESNEATHDAAQEAKIKALMELQQSAKSAAGQFGSSLTGNVSRVQALVSVGLRTLGSDEETDKQAMLAKVLAVVGAAKRALDSTVTAQKADLRAAIRQSMDKMEEALNNEKAAASALQEELDNQIRSLSQGDSVREGEWTNDVQTLYALLARLRAGAHRNNTQVHKDMGVMMDKVQSEQGVVASLATADRAEFKNLSRADSEALKINFTLTMANEGTDILAAFSQDAQSLTDHIGTYYQGPSDKEVDLRNRVGALAGKITTGFNARLHEIRSINFTDSTYQNNLAEKIKRFKLAVRDAMYAGEAAKQHSFNRLDRMRGHLQRLLRASNSLNTLKAQIEALESGVEVVHKAVTDDYTFVAQSNGGISGKIATLRSQLQEASNNLQGILSVEAEKRTQGHVNSTLEMEVATARMGRIERDIRLMEKRLRESRGRGATPAAEASAPEGAPAAEASAPEAAPEVAPEAAPEAAPAAAPAADQGGGEQETSAPAPAPQRPPLAEGETPSPEPLPWWEYRTEVSGLDFLQGKIALKNGATSGFLRGVYPLSAEGRWTVYCALYASQVPHLLLPFKTWSISNQFTLNLSFVARLHPLELHARFSMRRLPCLPATHCVDACHAALRY